MLSGGATRARVPSANRSWRRDAGLALPAVIAVGAAVAALTGTWFESALTESRRIRIVRIQRTTGGRTPHGAAQ